MSIPTRQNNPLEVPSDNTTGADTERNYRYQHAYGAILLIGAACDKLPYVSIYAEHHEDLFGVRSDDLIDGYQIKTREPEYGAWDLTDQAVKKSIKKFVALHNKFPEAIGNLKFVSNVDYSNPGLEIKDQVKLRRSPYKFLEAVKISGSFNLIAEPFSQTFEELKAFCGCTSNELFETLTKMEFIRGPDRESFDAEIVATHLIAIPQCSNESVNVLHSIRKELIHRVWLASNKVNDPSKHWLSARTISNDNPYISEKKVPVEVVLEIVNQEKSPSFLYRNKSTLELGNGKGNLWRLRKKMERGKLHSQIETMERRSISAEQTLIEHATTRPEEIETLLTQLESVVKGECDEAFLNKSIESIDGEEFGQKMMADVYVRLQEKAKNSKLVFGQPYELLIGMAGLLTGECKVWWSHPFNVEDEQ